MYHLTIHLFNEGQTKTLAKCLDRAAFASGQRGVEFISDNLSSQLDRWEDEEDDEEEDEDDSEMGQYGSSVSMEEGKTLESSINLSKSLPSSWKR